MVVQHQMLFGKLAATEYVEVVTSEPGMVTVRAVGGGVFQTASG